MTRYQKHSIIATLRGISLVYRSACVLCALATLFCTTAAASGAPLFQVEPSPLFPALYITPVSTSAVELHTHTADFTLINGADGLTASLTALYRLRNPTDALLTLTLRIAPASGANPVLGGTLALTENGQPLALQPAEAAGYTTEVTIPADASIELTLVYADLLAATRLPSLLYDARNLFGWPGRLSLRVSMTAPNAIDADSWLRLEPAGWAFGMAPSAQQTTIKWLFEASWPTEPFLWRFVHPDSWLAVRKAAVAAGPGADLTAFLNAGDLYRSLYLESMADERFYAQALALYSAGLAEGQARQAGAVDLAPLYAGLAALYRNRMVEPDGRVNPAYAELTALNAGAALTGLAPASARRPEVEQWQADSLRQLLADARQRGEWLRVAELLDRIATLPETVLPPAQLAEEQRIAAVQQALYLLRQGNRLAATALAGPAIVAAATAPQTSLPLATTWQVTVTVALDETAATFVAAAPVDGEDRAAAALQERLAGWRTAAAATGAQVTATEFTQRGQPAWRLEFASSEREGWLAFAESLPPNPDWALMRTVMQQLAPQRLDRSGFFRRDLAVTQSYDLRAVAHQWEVEAQRLGEQAAALEAQGTIGASDDVTAVETALTASVQAVNYRSAADLWQNLIDNSSVVTRLQLPDGLGVAERVWLTTVTSAPQPYNFQVRDVNPTSILGGLFALLSGLFVASGLLWRLL